MEKNSVSNLSTYSISVFGFGLFIGVMLDIFFPMRFLSEPLNEVLGVIIVLVSTLFIFWAEKHGNSYSKKRKAGAVDSVDHMLNGPYKYTRNPKYLGLGLLLIGLGCILNDTFIIITSVVSALIVHFYFLKKEEALLEERHGDVYKEYKNKVRKWL